MIKTIGKFDYKEKVKFNGVTYEVVGFTISKVQEQKLYSLRNPINGNVIRRVPFEFIKRGRGK